MSNKIVLAGNKNLLKTAITQILAVHQLLEQKDFGGSSGYRDLESIHRVGKPKVALFFLEDTNFNQVGTNPNTPQGRRRTEGVIRFRLMDETTQTFSKTNATTLGRRIKEVFGANGGFVWNKGKTLYNYNDWERGYQFQLLCRTKTEAKRIITAVLSLQSHPIDWKFLFENKNDQEALAYPEIPEQQVVMGELVSKPRIRPNVDVRFQYAYVSLSGVKEPIILYDRTNKKVGALVN